MLAEMIAREFGRHRLRTILTILGITIGIFLVTTVSSFSEGITVYVNDQISITSGLVMVIQSDIPGFSVQTSEIDQSYLDDVRNINGVDVAAPVLFRQIEGYGYVTGVDPESANIFTGGTIEIEEGSGMEAGAYEIELGNKYAENNRLSVGDILKLKDKEFEVVGIFQKTGKDQIDNQIIVPLDTLQELTDSEDIISIISIKPLTPEDADRIEQTINDNYDDIQAATDKTIMKSVNEMLGQLSIMVFSIGSIAAIISAIVIMNVMIMAVRERRKEIGVMKAVGATNNQILKEFLFESLSISMMGGFLGLGLSFFGVIGVNSILASPIALITPRLAILSLVFAASIGIVSGIVPARQAAKVDPIVAVRYE